MCIRDRYDTLKETSHYIPELKDFEMDTALSTIDDIVFHNKITGETNISFRGTQKLSDWKTNLKTMIDFGADEGKLLNKSPLIKNAISTAEKVANKYGTKQLTLSSHSLGGTKATEVAHYFADKGVFLENHMYDPGLSLRQLIKNNNYPKEFIQNVYRTHFDSPSSLVGLSNVKTPKNLKIKNINTNIEIPIETPLLDMHSLEHFLTNNKTPKILKAGKIAVQRSTNAKVLSDALKFSENALQTASKSKIGVVFKALDKAAVPLQIAAVGYESYLDWEDPNKSLTTKVTDVTYNVAESGAEVGVGIATDMVVGGMVLAMCPECLLVAATIGAVASIGTMVGLDIGLDAGNVKEETEKFVGDNVDDVEKGANEMNKEAKELGKDIEDGFNSSIDFAEDSFEAVGNVFTKSWW